MKINDKVDIDELTKTGDCFRKYFAKIAVTEHQPIRVFLALFDLAIENIEKGDDLSDMSFSAVHICIKSNNKKENYEVAKEFISRHKKNFDKFIKDNLEEITHYFSLNGVKYLPIIKNTDSKGGHKTNFYIGLTPVSGNIKHELKLNTEIKQDAVSIEYTVPQLPKAATWAKSLLNLKISGWKFYSYITLPILAGVIAYCLLLWNLFAISSTSLVYTIIIGSLLAGLYFLLIPFYEAIDKRIGLAPVWLTKLEITSAQLRYVRTENKKSNGNYVRALQLVVYQAKCPICDNEVLIEKGKHAHKGRLIGVCNESPREHVFSFDHVTKKGRLLYPITQKY